MKTFSGFHLLLGAGALMVNASAATLTGSFSPLTPGANINLSAEGKLDWVHWGFPNETSVNRKATVNPQISDFAVVYENYTVAYQQTNCPNGFSWSDGTAAESATNTTTGVYVLGPKNPAQQINGFQFTVPADPSPRILKVYVGTYGARGRMEAVLSDFATTYSDASLANQAAGPGGVYTIVFAANSSNQTLTVRWTESEKNNSDANVTLQAATLSYTNANNPPFAKITAPESDGAFAAPAEFTMTAEVFDFDDSVVRVEFFSNGIRIGESTNSPFSLSLSNIPPGRYELIAKPIDKANASSTSRPVEIFVHCNGGALNGSVDVPSGVIDLTAEGTLDWMHWGLDSAADVNRKRDALPRIQMTALGTNTPLRYADNLSAYTWSDGSPEGSSGGTQTGIFLPGSDSGFQLSVPADPASKTLKVYVGLYGGSGHFQAWLSDFSAPVFADRSLSNGWDNAYAVYTLDYRAASRGQTLKVNYTPDSLFDEDFGNVTLQAAALSGTALLAANNAQVSNSDFTFSVEADFGKAYTILYSDGLNSPDWKILTNFVGAGAVKTVLDNSSQPQRFYRIQSY